MNIIKTYAEEFASLLNVTLPELGVAARLDRPEFEQRRCFSFQVPCPSAAVLSPLSITVDQSAIMVEFLSARSNFTNPHEAVALIHGLIEETVIVETWFGQDSADCAFVNVNALPHGPYKVSGVTRVVRQSWKGKHDADENVA